MSVFTLIQSFRPQLFSVSLQERTLKLTCLSVTQIKKKKKEYLIYPCFQHLGTKLPFPLCTALTGLLKHSIQNAFSFQYFLLVVYWNYLYSNYFYRNVTVQQFLVILCSEHILYLLFSLGRKKWPEGFRGKRSETVWPDSSCREDG